MVCEGNNVYELLRSKSTGEVKYWLITGEFESIEKMQCRDWCGCLLALPVGSLAKYEVITR